MPLSTQSFQIDGAVVKSDVPLTLQGFKDLFGIQLFLASDSLPILPTLGEVDYVKVENGVVSIVLL